MFGDTCASDILYRLTHIGMSGNFLYNQGVRRALGLQLPPAAPRPGSHWWQSL